MLPDPPSSVTRLGKYEIVRRLGRGGMAEIFEARHLELATRVALKVMNPAIGTTDGGIERVLREGRAAAAIRHPNVVTVLDVGADERIPYLVMELLEGEDLASRLARDAPLTVEDITEILLPVISGACAAHRAGIIHRDLKPSNVFLARRHHGIEPVVVDFGISKVMLPSPSPAPSSRVIAGTAQYMAPEQLRGAGRASPKSDQYALGVILYECATGGAPFWDEDHYELLHSIMTAPVVPPSELNPRIPKELDAVVLRALARDPESRFGSLAALGGALLRFARRETRQRWSEEFGAHAIAESVSLTRTSGSQRSLLIAFSLLALAGAIGCALALRRPPLARASNERPTGEELRTNSGALVPASEEVRHPIAESPDLFETRTPPAPSTPLAASPARVVKAPALRPLAHASVRPPPSSAPALAPTVERGTANIPIVE